jgi:hypothetical protein
MVPALHHAGCHISYIPFVLNLPISIMRIMHRFELAIAAIFRNEAPYLREWIEFHREVGCEHFYLFNNLSTDGYSSVLQPYIDRGIVDLVCWPLEHDQCLDWSLNQCLAYERALLLARGQAKWLAIIDTDEFLFPTKKSSLPSFLSQYEDCAGIGVNWQLFGTSRVEKVPEDRLLIEMLQYRLPSEAPANHLIKSVVRPEFVSGCESSHCVKYLDGWGHVNTDRVRFEGKSSPYVQVDAVRINHYQVRDEHYLRTQKLPRVLKWWSLQPAEKWEALYNSYNEVQDGSMERFVPRIYSRLNSSM